MTYQGSCHCGQIAFEAEGEITGLLACNCSMCQKVGFIHVIVPESRFRILQGGDRLTEYTFNTGAAETMECVAGSCEYKLAGSSEWRCSSAGEKFSIPANSSFEIRVAEAYHYICHFG